MSQTGKVYLVGAGPGDIGLITVKGLEAIKKADVILYDRLANPKLLDFTKTDCEIIYCGKLPHRHILRQEAINDLLVEKALAGKVVTRLKGGDPSVFGRVGEEAEELKKQGISFEIVPGITSGIAAPLYAGIPVTHREYGSSFAVVTAHDKSDNGEPSIDWEGLSKGVDTIAFYMGVANLSIICEQLMRYGRNPETPVILIQWGTFGRQKTLEGNLKNIVDKVKQAGFTNPAITLVGDIIKFRENMRWFEDQPLFGRQVLLARTSTGESELAKKLRGEGADVIEFPKWKNTEATVDKNILNYIHLYDHILFTSPASVDYFFKILQDCEVDIRNIKAGMYAQSRKSKASLASRGIVAKIAESLKMEGTLLIVGDSEVKEQYENNSLKYGAHDIWVTVEKSIDEQFYPIMERMLEDAEIDTIILPSSAAIHSLIDYKSLAIHKLLKEGSIIAMGEQTEKAAMAMGIKIDKRLNKPDFQHLLEVLTNSGKDHMLSVK